MNAKKELLQRLKDKSKVKCAYINTNNYYGKNHPIILKVNYTDKEYEAFLMRLDFNYNNNTGSIYVDGIVWLEDKTWFSRDLNIFETEVWKHNILPDIPSECL